MSLNMVTVYSLIVFDIFSVSECLCLHYYLHLITNLVLRLGIIALQVDRLIAIYWDIHYTEYVTNSRAMEVCVFNLVIGTAVGVGFVTGYRTNEYGKCTHLSILFTRKTNTFLNGIPQIIAVIVTTVVSIYVVWKTKRLANSVQPTNQLTMYPRPEEVQVEIQCRHFSPDRSTKITTRSQKLRSI